MGVIDAWTPAEFGLVLKDIRGAFRIKLVPMARAVGIPPATLSRTENGKRELSYDERFEMLLGYFRYAVGEQDQQGQPLLEEDLAQMVRAAHEIAVLDRTILAVHDDISARSPRFHDEPRDMDAWHDHFFYLRVQYQKLLDLGDMQLRHVMIIWRTYHPVRRHWGREAPVINVSRHAKGSS